MARKAKEVVAVKAPRKSRKAAAEVVTQEAVVETQAEDTSSEAGEGSASQEPATEAATPVAATSTRSVVDRKRYDYVTHKAIKTQSGRAAVDNDDPVASALRGLTLEQVTETLTNSGGEISEKWAKLNPGMQRMSMGNVIRRFYNEGKTIHLPDGSELEGVAKEKATPKKRVRKTKAKPEATEGEGASA